MTTVNLIPNPSFVVDTAGWNGNNLTLAFTTDKYLYGASSLSLTATATSNTWTYTDPIPVVVGQVYTLSAYVLSAATSRNMNVQITWYDSSSAAISSSSGTVQSSSTTLWKRLTVSGTAPALAVTAVCYVVITSPSVSQVHYVDAVQFENSSAVTQFLDTSEQSKETSVVNKALTKLPQPHLTGMVLAGDIRINGLTLNTVDANNVVWVCTDIEGWWNAPGVEVQDYKRGLDDGSYDVRGRWTARSLTLSGSILTQTPSQAVVARQELLEAFNLVYTGAWLFVDESPKKAAYVRLAAQPTVTNVNARGRINFSIPLKAGDPIKYGWTGLESGDGLTVSSNLSTTQTVSNAGNTDVAANFVVTAPITAPAYITSVSNGTTQTIKMIKDLRSTSFTTSNVSNSVNSSGIATLTITNPANVSAHGFLVGDTVTITNVAARYNKANVVVTAITSNTLSYVNPGVNVTSITHTSNVATVTTAAAHGMSAGNQFFISGTSNPIFEGVGTVVSNLSSTTFTFSKVASNQPTSYEGKLSYEIASASVTSGVATLAINDTLEIDTYNNSVSYRGLPDSSRSMLAADIDWIKLKPGNNSVTFTKTGGAGNAVVEYRSGWIG